MTEKEILIELLKAADEDSARRCITDYNEAIAENADYLLSNGVIVPPCKAGDVVYLVVCECFMFRWGMIECTIEEIVIRKTGTYISMMSRGGLDFEEHASEIGKSVFFARDEAEKALAERSNNATNS